MECCVEQLLRLTSCKPTPRTYPHDAKLDFRVADDSA